MINEVNGLELVTITAATKLCSVSRRTIYLWIHKGKIKTTRVPSGAIRIFKYSLFEHFQKENIIYIVVHHAGTELLIESAWDTLEAAEVAIDKYAIEANQLRNSYDIIERKLNSLKGLPDGYIQAVCDNSDRTIHPRRFPSQNSRGKN